MNHGICSRRVTPWLLCVAIAGGALEMPGHSHSQPTLLKAQAAEYPPTARTARVSGDVHLHLMIRRDGSVESADVIDGPAMLRTASTAGAGALLFDCTMCNEQFTPYELTLRFQIVPTIAPKNCDEPMPQGSQIDIDPQQHVVTVSTPEIWTCDPVVAPPIILHHVRAARCMYLWKCASRSKMVTP